MIHRHFFFSGDSVFGVFAVWGVMHLLRSGDVYYSCFQLIIPVLYTKFAFSICILPCMVCGRNISETEYD